MNVVIPAPGPGIVFTGKRLEYPPEYVVQHLSVCMPLFIELVLTNMAAVDRNLQESDHYVAVG